MKNIPTFVIAFLVLGFFFIAMPEKGYSGTPIIGCCQSFEPVTCSDVFTDGGRIICEESILGDEYFEGEICDVGTQDCTDAPPTLAPIPTDVPTLSGWGFISLAVVLGVLGLGAFLVRRKKASA